MYCGRNIAQLLKISAMYFSTPTCPASALTTSCNDEKLSVKFRRFNLFACYWKHNTQRYPFNMRRFVGWFVDSSTADEQELLHTSTLGPVHNRPTQGEKQMWSKERSWNCINLQEFIFLELWLLNNQHKHHKVTNPLKFNNHYKPVGISCSSFCLFELWTVFSSSESHSQFLIFNFANLIAIKYTEVFADHVNSQYPQI